jgi:tight adherence protein B
VIRARLAICVALVTAFAVAGTASAAAPPAPTIQSINTSKFPDVSVTVKTATGSSATPQLVVTENGQPAAGVDQSADTNLPAIALLNDTSMSMRGQPLADAKAAATSFVFSQSPDTVMAVYGFDSSAYVSTPFPSDRTATTNAINQLFIGAKPGTALYSSVIQASNDLAKQSQQKHVILLMTDGHAANDPATLQQAQAAAKKANVTIFAVTTSSDQAALAPLRSLADGSGGEMIPVTNSSALAAAYKTIGNSLNSTVNFSYHSLVPPGKPIQLSVSVNGSAAATQTVKAPGTYTGATTSGGSSVPANAAGRAAIAGLVALFVLAGALILLSSKPAIMVGKRIAPHTEQKKQVVVVAPGQEIPKISILHQLYVATEKIAGSFNYWKRISFRLEQANLPLRTAEVVYLQMGSGILLAAIVSLLLRLGSIAALISLVIGAVIPWMYVKIMAKRRLNAFETQLPETLITLAASLKAGHAFNSALNSVVKEGVEPTSTELSRVSSEIQLGMPSETALESMAIRMDSTNFGFVVMAVNIQRTVGGSLAEILDMVADTVRQRQQFSRKVKALTAQGRMSAYVLLGMPFFMALAIFALNQQYITVLFTETAGQMMIAGSLFMMAIGGLIIKKIVSFKE